MKKNFLFILITTMILSLACGGNKSDKQPENILHELEQESAEGKNAESGDAVTTCDEFLDNYEKWVMAYLELMEKYINDPMDTETLEEYTKVIQEMGNWTTQWTTMYTCAAKDKYVKRYEEIGEKVEKKMEDLGLE